MISHALCATCCGSCKLAAVPVLLTFAVKNTDPVAVRYFLGHEWRAPLIFVLLIFFCVGAALGLLAALGHDRAAAARDRARSSASCSRREPGARAAAARRRGALKRARSRPHGSRVLVAARAAALLRARLAGRAHRHQAARVGIARAADVVLQGPQLPPERAARQGDRGVHRGGQGRSADGRAALRARQPLPAARRGRARDPHAPEPRRAHRSRRRSRSSPRSSSSRRTT